MKNLLLLQQVAETEACGPIDDAESISKAIEDDITADFNSHFQWKGMLVALCIVAFVSCVFIIPWLYGVVKIIQKIGG